MYKKDAHSINFRTYLFVEFVLVAPTTNESFESPYFYNGSPLYNDPMHLYNSQSASNHSSSRTKKV